MFSYTLPPNIAPRKQELVQKGCTFKSFLTKFYCNLCFFGKHTSFILFNPNGHYHEWNAVLIELALQCENGVVMKPSAQERFLVKDELSAEEYGAGILADNLACQSIDFGNNFCSHVGT